MRRNSSHPLAMHLGTPQYGTRFAGTRAPYGMTIKSEDKIFKPRYRKRASLGISIYRLSRLWSPRRVLVLSGDLQYTIGADAIIDKITRRYPYNWGSRMTRSSQQGFRPLKITNWPHRVFTRLSATPLQRRASLSPMRFRQSHAKSALEHTGALRVSSSRVWNLTRIPRPPP